MRAVMLTLILIIFSIPFYSDTVFAKIDKQTITVLKEQTDFELKIPKKLSFKALEIKEPYPLDLSKKINKVRLHYFDSTGDNLLIGITQHKANSYEETMEIIIVRPNNHSETKIKLVEFKPNFERGDKIFINGNEGRFLSWGQSSLPGGILWWIDNNTYIEMDSSNLTKNQMIKIAKSMK
jgi:hypothetical protein